MPQSLLTILLSKTRVVFYAPYVIFDLGIHEYYANIIKLTCNKKKNK